MAAVALGLVAPASAATSTGPKLTVAKSTMNKALTCTGNLKTGKLSPVLFLHGTTSNSKANWSWNWDRAMDLAKRPRCDLDSPNGATGDIQVSAEYVVNAIRTMHTRAGKKISIVGHSQGGMVGRWALNTGPETWPGISCTVIATKYDEIGAPATAGFLKSARNVTNTTVQDICPAEFVEHFGMAYDNAAWLVGIDALTHTGPAKLSRINRSTCGIPTMPSVDPSTFAPNTVAALAVTARNSAVAKNLPTEPALRSYAR